MKEKIAIGEQLIQESKLLDAKSLFTEILENTFDTTSERIIKNRLLQINKQIKASSHHLETTSAITQTHLICTIKLKFKTDYIQQLIAYLFKDTHKINYETTSSIVLNFFGNAAKIDIKTLDSDEKCCTFCKKFRQKLIENIGKEDIVVEEDCFLTLN